MRKRHLGPKWVPWALMVLPVVALLGIGGTYWGWTESVRADQVQQRKEVYEEYLLDTDQAEKYGQWLEIRQSVER